MENIKTYPEMNKKIKTLLVTGSDIEKYALARIEELEKETRDLAIEVIAKNETIMSYVGYEEIVKLIIETVKEGFSGFQRTVPYADIEECYELYLELDHKLDIVEALENLKEVADVELDSDGFDVVLYTDYAPNHAEGLNIELDICNKCGGLMPSGRILCKECV